MTNLTPRNYACEVAEAKLPVLICVHNDKILPPQELEALCGTKLKCCTLNAQQHEELVQKFRVLSLPAALLVHNGQIVQRIQGERSLHDLANILNLN